MLALAHKKDLQHVPGGYKEDPVQQFGPKRRVHVYRFTLYDFPVVAFDCDDYVKIFEDSEVQKKHIPWLLEQEDPPEFLARMRFIHSELAAFKPTHFIFNEQSTLKIAMDKRNSHVCARIYIIHDCHNLPFGPYARGGPWQDSQITHSLLHDRMRRVEGLWGVSKAVQKYFEVFGGLTCHHVPCHPWIYGTNVDDIPYYDNFDAPYVTAVNPGVTKGFHIVRGLAKAVPSVPFLVVKSWSMNQHVIDKFEKLKNVTLKPPCKDMEQIWYLTKLLLVPSTFFETFGLVVVEALLRGIPVISSDAGGLPEAHLSIPYTIPTKIITGEPETNPLKVRKYGKYKVPRNDIGPWIEAVCRVGGWEREWATARRRRTRRERRRKESLPDHSRSSSSSSSSSTSSGGGRSSGSGDEVPGSSASSASSAAGAAGVEVVDRSVYDNLRRMGRERAVEFVKSLKHEFYEELLEEATKKVSKDIKG
ncbi:hypothetical protein HK104_009932 [Borealophlyctis nickersoniae]|nr:hypothetical protein HK104_009932 [Borealophlyctis nickersoniae]